MAVQPLPPLPTRLLVSGAGVRPAGARARRTPWLAAIGIVMLLPTASCVPDVTDAQIATASAMVSVPTPRAAIAPELARTIASFTAPVDASVSAAATADGSVPDGFVGAAPSINAAIPFAVGGNTPALPFFGRARAASDQMRSLQCLAEAIYYEAASETDDGQRAVAQVVLNRMRHPAYPASVCGVVYQNAHRWLACQFSFACDGARARVPSASGWARARAHAAQALAGRVFAPVGTSTHYHTWNVVPFWAHKLEKSAVVGAHIFYRLNGAAGRGGAFSQRYAGYEPGPAPVALPPTRIDMALLGAVPLKVAELAPAKPGQTMVKSEAVPLPSAELVTAPKPAPSPIMRAVEGSTVREEFANSGALRPEFAGR